jgi:hypothetical protein
MVSIKAEETLKQVVSNAALPDEVNEFIRPFLSDRRLLGFVFTRFSSEIRTTDANLVLDDDDEPRRQGILLQMIIDFIERGGLQLILEFILALVGAFS